MAAAAAIAVAAGEGAGMGGWILGEMGEKRHIVYPVFAEIPKFPVTCHNEFPVSPPFNLKPLNDELPPEAFIVQQAIAPVTALQREREGGGGYDELPRLCADGHRGPLCDDSG